VKDALEEEIAGLKTKASDLSTSLRDAVEERESLTENLISSQKAVTRLTSTLEGISDERDKLEQAIAAAKVYSVACSS
jgi:predicted  nucleic acid-binding Zn-ribbon protein